MVGNSWNPFSGISDDFTFRRVQEQVVLLAVAGKSVNVILESLRIPFMIYYFPYLQIISVCDEFGVFEYFCDVIQVDDEK